jgi:hypothetical protein
MRLKIKRRDILVSKATGYGVDDHGSIPGRARDFLLATAFTLALGPFSQQVSSEPYSAPDQWEVF